MCRLVQALAAAIPGARTREIAGAGHAAPFDAPSNFVELVAESIVTAASSAARRAAAG
jgi:pimeloyl-ACP methyl ester carboxylesterase